MWQKITLLFCVIIGAQSIPAPQLTPCKKDDGVCQTKNANIVFKQSVLGIPEKNIESLDPMFQENIVGDLGVIKYNLRNSTLEGFMACNVASIKYDYEKSKLDFNLVCPYFNMKGLYEISGLLFTLPIEGNGEYTVKAKDYLIHVETDFKIAEGTKGKRYLSFKSFKSTPVLKGDLIVDLTNLYNGQKDLADAALRFINENGKAVATLFQGPSFNANIGKLIKTLNKNLKTISLDKLIVQ